MSCCQRLAPHLVPATLWCWLPWRACFPFVIAPLWFLLPLRVSCPLPFGSCYPFEPAPLTKQKSAPPDTQIMRPMSLSVISLLIVVRDRDRGRPRATEGSHSERSISISTGMLVLPPSSTRARQPFFLVSAALSFLDAWPGSASLGKGQ